jgi:hypothetical protein
LCDSCSLDIGGVTSKVERLSGDEIVQRIVVEGGYVGGLPDLVLKTFLELVFENVAVSTVQEFLYFLLLIASDQL